MKNKKQFFKQVGRRFGILLMLPVAGLLGGAALFTGTLVMWLLGFIVVPIGIIQNKYVPRESTNKDYGGDLPSLPAWAWPWDDTLDLDVRGRPEATFVWTFGLSWGMATFVHLQFYNPLANIRTRFVEFQKAKTGRS